MSPQLAILGAGNMAEAIARGIVRSQVLHTDQMIAADISPQRRSVFHNELSIRCVESAAEAVRGAATVLISVKPQHMRQVLHEAASFIDDGALVISIAAGITIAFIEDALAPRPCRVIRAMPNTPMLVSAGVVAMSQGSRATSGDFDRARRLFEPSATVLQVTEDKLDAVTALSGSGPAYFFYLVEQMIRAGIEMGLSDEEAAVLALRTAVGSGRMLEGSSEPPQELRRRVTSPGGTTEAAITHMEQNHLDRIVIDAIKAARQRGLELGRRVL